MVYIPILNDYIFASINNHILIILYVILKVENGVKIHPYLIIEKIYEKDNYN
jgi:hypothetical protein